MPHQERETDTPQVNEGLSERITRRNVLRGGAAVGLGILGVNWLRGSDAHAGEDGSPMDRGTTAYDKRSGYIDAHVHVWTPDTDRYPLAAGFRREQMQPPSFEPDELLRHAKPCGVDRIVLIQMSFYGFDNSYMLDTMAKYPGVFSGVAVIDDGGDDPAGEMRRLKSAGVRGFRIYPRNKPVDHWLDGPGMQAMWKCGAAENLAMCHLVNPGELPAIDRMCEKYPDTPVVVDHYARIGIDGQIHAEDVKNLLRLARHKNTHVKLSAFYALGKKEPPYTDMLPLTRQLVDAYGPQRVMWATDCPFQVAGDQTYEQSLAVIRDHLEGVSESDREWLLRGTAEKVFYN